MHRCSILSFSETVALNFSLKGWIDGFVLSDAFQDDQNPILFISWKFESRKTRRSPFDFNILLILKFKILWNYRLEFFKKKLRRTILSKIGFLVKLIWCMYDQSGSCPINWKKSQRDCARCFRVLSWTFWILIPKNHRFTITMTSWQNFQFLSRKVSWNNGLNFRMFLEAKKIYESLLKKRKTTKNIMISWIWFLQFFHHPDFSGHWKKNKLSNFFAGCVFPVLWDGKNTKNKDFPHLSKPLFNNSSCWIYSVFKKIHLNK